MSETIVKVLPFSTDLAESLKKTYLDTLLATEDNEAHRFDISLFRDKAQLQMPSGAAVSAFFIRYSDNATISLTGNMSGNVASVTLKKSCYNKSGQFAVIIKVTDGNIISTVFYGEGTIFASNTDTIVDEENVVPSLSDLLAQIAVMEEATKDAQEATDAANEAAGHAPYVNTANNHWMTWDTDSGKYVDTGVSATGPVGPQGPAGANGTGSGTVTGIEVNGEVYEPDQTGLVDIGELAPAGLTSDPQEDESTESPEMGSVPINADQLGGMTYQQIVNMIYPIGRTITTLDDTDNPNTLYPWQTWERTAKGRMLIGTGAPEDNDDGTSPGSYNYAAGSKGGKANHSHSLTNSKTFAEILVADSGAIYQNQVNNSDSVWTANQFANYGAQRTDISGTITGAVGVFGATENESTMPPYIAANIWKRVS